MAKIVKRLFFIFILISIFASCKNKESRFYKQDVSGDIFYLELPPEANFGNVMQNQRNFKPLPQNARRDLNKILENKENLIWLKISFKIDDKLKNKMIALYVAQLNSAVNLWCNGNFIRKYGEFPPQEMNCGLIAQYYMFSRQVLDYEGENSVYIQVWPGPLGTLSGKIFLAEQAHVFRLAERHTFFNSRIIIAFMAFTFLIFFLYFILYLILRKHTQTRHYLYFSLLSLFSALFLIPFCVSEFSWAIPQFFSYLLIIKVFFSVCATLTIYFSYSFTTAYLEISLPKALKITRLIAALTPIIIVLLLPDYYSLAKVVPYQLIFISLDSAINATNLIKSFFNKEKRKLAIKLYLGFIPVAIAVASDLILRGIFQIDDLPYFTIYGWQFTIYVFLLYLVLQFGKTFDEVEKLNTNLEEIVAMRTKELSEANFVLSHSLESVAQVQKNFLPQKKRLFQGWDFSVYYKPLDNNVSGDLYDYYYSDFHLNGFGIFDVSGHGIQAGLMTILSKGIISQHFIGGLEQKLSLSKVLQEINSTYLKEKVNVANYITGLLFRFSNFDKNDVCVAELANAGHPYPIFWNSKEKIAAELKYENPEKQYGFIGVEGFEISFPTVRFPMANNDIILCFTDGLTESTNAKNEDFSKKRIMNLLEKNAHLTSNEIIKNIVDDFNDFTKDSEIHDDVTLIVIKRNNSKTFLEGI